MKGCMKTWYAPIKCTNLHTSETVLLPIHI